MNRFRSRSVREMTAAYLFLSPAFVFLIIFTAIPSVYALVLSFCKWDLITSPKFVGLAQWVKAVSSREATTSIGVTLGITMASAPIALAIGLWLAIMLDKLPFGKVLFRTAFFAPFVATLTAVSFVWSDLFNTTNGYFNYILQQIGLPPVGWLIYPLAAQISVSVVLIWQSIGFNMLLFLAGLQGIDQTYYEAAVVDGAKGRDIFWHITLPMLSPTTFFLLINMIIRGFQLYESVFILTAGGPGYSTTTLVYFIYRAAFKNYNIGLASALSMVLFVLIGITTMIMWRLQNRMVQYGD